MAEGEGAQGNEGEILDTNEDDLKDSFLKGDEKDMHRISSALGRALKDMGEQKKLNQQLTEVVKQMSEKIDSLTPTQPYVPTQDVSVNQTGLEKLNEKWQERILSGDVVGVLDEYNQLNKQAQENLSKLNKGKVDNILGTLKEKPFFDDVKDVVRENAYTLVSNGYSPEDATSYAFEKARADFQAKLLASLNAQNPGALETLRGGKASPPPEEKGKLPPNVEAACQRDIQAGIVKDRAEWIANLAPALKAQYGV